MAAIAASVERSRSVSSMRSSILPPAWRAKSQLNSAVRAPPIWRKPVGEGAKRVTTSSAMSAFLFAEPGVCSDSSSNCGASRKPRSDCGLRIIARLATGRSDTMTGRLRASWRSSPGRRLRKGGILPHAFGAPLGDPRRLLLQALELEIAERRLFLWLPVAAGSGVAWYLLADREPSLWFAGAAGARLRASRLSPARPTPCLWGRARRSAAFVSGFVSASWRAARVAAPVIDRIRIVTLEGFIEEMDFRRVGARFLLRPVESRGTCARCHAFSRAPHARPHAAFRGRHLCAAEGAASAAGAGEPAGRL